MSVKPTCVRANVLFVYCFRVSIRYTYRLIQCGYNPDKWSVLRSYVNYTVI